MKIRIYFATSSAYKRRLRASIARQPILILSSSIAMTVNVLLAAKQIIEGKISCVKGDSCSIFVY